MGFVEGRVVLGKSAGVDGGRAENVLRRLGKGTCSESAGRVCGRRWERVLRERVWGQVVASAEGVQNGSLFFES
eukprot:671479-Rhodomonas_salina.1